MRSRPLAVAGAFVFTPDVFPGERGLFVAPMQQQAPQETTGQASFPAAQVSDNRSHRRVVRGIHYTRTPPGCAKYVHCPRGQALDTYMPVGAGHALVALAEAKAAGLLRTLIACLHAMVTGLPAVEPG